MIVQPRCRFGEFTYRVCDDVGDRTDLFDSPRDFAREGDAVFELALEIDCLDTAREALHRVAVSCRETLCSFGSKGAQRRAAFGSNEDRVGFSGGDDRVLPALVDRRFEGRNHAGSHLNTLGAECEGRRPHRLRR